MDVLASSIAKLRSVLQLTNELSSVDFPHSHSRTALEHIGRIFQADLDQLTRLSATTDPAVVSALSLAQARKIYILFPLLGFILRSTDVRNAFEVHGPFLRIARRLLGQDCKLIISSEWEYSPFTFLPPTEFGLADTVFIGGPASEATNVLIIPIAGHELGHNVWAKQKHADKIGPILWVKILNHISTTRWADFVQHFPQLKDPKDLSDLLGSQTWAPAWEWALRQCEEIFCDLIGISIFRESFLHAASYLLAPSLPSARNPDYPASRQRAHIHVMAANKYGVQVPKDYEARFQNEQARIQQPIRIFVEIADFVVSELVDQLVSDARDVVIAAGIAPSTNAEIAEITRCFSQCVPSREMPNLPAIINAAWNYYLSGMQEWKAMYPKIAKSDAKLRNILSDLVLKTIEVFEIEQRQA